MTTNRDRLRCLKATMQMLVEHVDEGIDAKVLYLKLLALQEVAKDRALVRRRR